MTLIKICGNRTPEDVLAAADAGADFVGMVFAESKRQITIDEAQAMVRALGPPLADHEFSIPPPAQAHAREEIEPWFHHGADVVDAYLDVKRPLTIGVFADQLINEVNEIAEEVGLDLVQLSGDESWEDCLLVTKQVLQIVHVSALDSPSDALNHVQPGFAIALGLDSAHGVYRGGSGETFDWEVARAIAARIPIMLAGGLNSENVAEAISMVGPWIVDVSSGTETDGIRDLSRINAFVAAVVAADEQTT
jgi:phosphoribosylanthranilate isomerase